VRIHLVKHVQGNFGDELNRWLWHRLLADVRDGSQDDVLFVGIGTILDRNLPPARVTIVFGTGVGYTSPPPGISTDSSRWRIYGVRGPLTARALHFDTRFAMTDPAVLLATLSEFQGIDRSGVIFVPHWKSVRYGNWQGICKTLGIEFVDPCGDSKIIVKRIAGAEKVIAESMHAAIIADAFRVPWIPVALSREVSPFKWVDWASSVDVSYLPACLPASNRIEHIRNALLEWSAFANTPGYPSSSAVAAGISMRFDDVDRLMVDYEQIGRRINQKWRWNGSIAVEVILKRLSKLGFGSSTRMRTQATERLADLMSERGSLSSDQSHTRSLEDTLGRLETFKSDLARGAFA
jgi:succinoglycan biosynthesis protein ExoV